MTTRDQFDIDGMDGVEPENYPGHIVNPGAWHPRPSAGARVMAVGMFLVVVACSLTIISWATGWMADEVTRWLP